MSDDRLRAALSDLRDSALGQVQPPGIERVRATVRTRRTRRVVTAVTAGLLVAAAIVVPVTRATPPPVDPAVTTTPPTTTSVAPSPTGSPSASVNSASQPACASDAVVVVGPGGVRSDADDIVRVPVRFVSLPAPGITPCAGFEVKAWWASYTVTGNGTELRFDTSGWTRLGRVDGTVRLDGSVGVRGSDTCSGWLVGFGEEDVIPDRLPVAYVKTFGLTSPEPGDPLWDAAHGRRVAIAAGLTPC